MVRKNPYQDDGISAEVKKAKRMRLMDSDDEGWMDGKICTLFFTLFVCMPVFRFNEWIIV